MPSRFLIYPHSVNAVLVECYPMGKPPRRLRSSRVYRVLREFGESDARALPGDLLTCVESHFVVHEGAWQWQFCSSRPGAGLVVLDEAADAHSQVLADVGAYLEELGPVAP